MYHLQGGGAGGPGGVPPVHVQVQLGDDEEDGEEPEEEEEEEEEEVGEGDEAGEGVRQVSGEGAQGDREGGGGGGEVGVVEGGANGEVAAQMQHLGPAEDAERMSSSSPSSLFRYIST